MTYFHTGIRTIIGAKAFHCPVRDGKEWYHLAMVIRHNGLPGLMRSAQTNSQSRFSAFIFDCGQRQVDQTTQAQQTVLLNSTFSVCVFTQVCQSYRVKPHEQLVLVSLTHYCASTPSLSTSWS
jgi:hypothetical protein